VKSYLSLDRASRQAQIHLVGHRVADHSVAVRIDGHAAVAAIALQPDEPRGVLQSRHGLLELLTRRVGGASGDD
jgi:hypothetical protein